MFTYKKACNTICSCKLCWMPLWWNSVIVVDLHYLQEIYFVLLNISAGFGRNRIMAPVQYIQSLSQHDVLKHCPLLQLRVHLTHFNGCTTGKKVKYLCQLIIHCVDLQSSLFRGDRGSTVPLPSNNRYILCTVLTATFKFSVIFASGRFISAIGISFLPGSADRTSNNTTTSICVYTCTYKARKSSNTKQTKN